MVDKIWYNMEELIGGSEERVLIETQWNVKVLRLPEESERALVLIETQWNVKTEYSHVDIIPANGINRNIVECKVINITE